MDFTHFNENGMARMVDVSEKNETQRKATARGYIKMAETTIEAIKREKIKKGRCTFSCSSWGNMWS